jgi:hypothetical protein
MNFRDPRQISRSPKVRISDHAAFRAALACVAVATCLGLAACQSGTADATPAPEAADGKQVFTRPTWTTSSVGDTAAKPPAPAGTVPTETAAKRTTWAILLGAVSGPGSDRQAATLAAVASREGGMADTFIEPRGDGFAVLYGAYDEPGSPQAKKDLAAARAIDVGGAKPFEGAIMAAPAVRGAAGNTPEHDLRLAKQIYGKKASFTLQIGVYHRSDREKPTPDQVAEIRKAAEGAVKALREQGDQAFYFHGPERSMVTVGLFPTAEDAAIRAIQKRFPSHMINGQLTTNAKSEQLNGPKGQPSFVVTVP